MIYSWMKAIHELSTALFLILISMHAIQVYGNKIWQSENLFLSLVKWRIKAILPVAVVMLGSGIYLALSTSMFGSEDDRWLLYKTGIITIMFIGIFISLSARFILNRANFVLILVLFVMSFFISVLKPYVLNLNWWDSSSIPTETSEGTQSDETEVEEIIEEEIIEE